MCKLAGNSDDMCHRYCDSYNHQLRLVGHLQLFRLILVLLEKAIVLDAIVPWVSAAVLRPVFVIAIKENNADTTKSKCYLN